MTRASTDRRAWRRMALPASLLICACCCWWLALRPSRLDCDGQWLRVSASAPWWPEQMEIDGAGMHSADGSWALRQRLDDADVRYVIVERDGAVLTSLALRIEQGDGADLLVFAGADGAVYRRRDALR